MLNILICDDDIKFINILKDRITNICANRRIEYQIKYYLSAIEILEENATENINVIFLDIDMPNMNGFEFAEKLKDINIHIIFVTNRDELVFQSLKYHPFYFIRKNHIDEEIESQIIQIDSLINNSNKKIIFIDTNNGSSPLEIDEIVYVENTKNYITIHMIHTEPITTRKSMKDMETDLSKYGFIRVHAGYIVNVRYVKKFNNKEVELLNDKVIAISRSKSKYVKEKIMEEILND